VAADLKEAERSVLQARDRCIGRLSAEVFAPMDQRLHTHEQIREALRQRRRLGKFADSARLAVATLRKGEVFLSQRVRLKRNPQPGKRSPTRRFSGRLARAEQCLRPRASRHMEADLEVTPLMAKRLLNELLQSMQQDLDRGLPVRPRLFGCFASRQQLANCLQSACGEDRYLKSLFSVFKEMAELQGMQRMS
ncbi:unnamed protein product, partial [Effrenium voratum]